MDQGNRDTWYAGNGFSRPYPGDAKVLLPDEVPGASDAPAPTAAAGGTDK